MREQDVRHTYEVAAGHEGDIFFITNLKVIIHIDEKTGNVWNQEYVKDVQDCLTP